MCYKRAAELNPLKGEYYQKAAYCYTKTGNTESAEEFYGKSLLYLPNDHDANLVMGIINYKKGNYQLSEKYLRMAASINRTDSQPLLYLLKLYFDTGKLQDAKSYSEELKQRKVKIPTHIDSVLYPGNYEQQ